MSIQTTTAHRSIPAHRAVPGLIWDPAEWHESPTEARRRLARITRSTGSATTGAAR